MVEATGPLELEGGTLKWYVCHIAHIETLMKNAEKSPTYKLGGRGVAHAGRECGRRCQEAQTQDDQALHHSKYEGLKDFMQHKIAVSGGFYVPECYTVENPLVPDFLPILNALKCTKA